MKKIDYEKSIERLEEIVDRLESGETSIEESIKLFEEGTRLSKSCYQVLQRAEQKIIQLSELENKPENDEDE